MERYLEQILSDIACASENVSFPFVEHEFDLHDWVSPEEEDKTAPIRKFRSGFNMLPFATISARSQ